MYQAHTIKPRDIVLWAIFLSALGVVILAVTSFVFPNLVVMTMGTMPDYFNINPYEPGEMAYPFLITNFILLGIAILYFKHRLPQKILSSFKFISNFEISSKMTFLVMLLLIGGFITFTVNQLYTPETFPDYFNRLLPALSGWTPGSVTKGFDLHLKYFFDIASLKLFGSYKVIPYLGSISLLILTYFFTKLITKSRFAGIVSMAILLQSTVFVYYSTSVTYDNFWILFYLLSLYVIYRFWALSAISFIASVFTKPLIEVFLPFSLFFIYRSTISRRRKILAAVSYIPLVIIGIYALNRFGGATTLSSLNIHGFWSAFNAFAYQLRYDPVLVLFLLPVTVMLFMTARRRVIHADSILFLLMGTVLSQPLQSVLTFVLSEPYRFVFLVTLFGISLGTLISKNVQREGMSISQNTLPVSPGLIK